MFNDIINRQAFEFTCKAEETAKRIQHEIEAHTAASINQIVQSILSGGSEESNYLKIDKIEIDLGNIAEYDFGGLEMLTSFKEILQRQISAEKSKNRPEALSDIQQELQLIESFLLHGDVPWWVDKHIPFNIDSVVHKFLQRHPRALRQLLESIGKNPNVVLRLFTQMKPATLAKIVELAPVLSPAFAKERFIYETPETGVDLSPIPSPAFAKERFIYETAETGIELAPVLSAAFANEKIISETPETGVDLARILSAAFAKERFIDETPWAGIERLSPLMIKRLKSIFRKLHQSPAGLVKMRLVNRLMELYRQIRLNRSIMEETNLKTLFSIPDAHQLLLLLLSSATELPANEQRKKKEIIGLTNNLTVFQAEFLLSQLSPLLNKDEFKKLAPDPALNHSLDKMIAFIMKRMNTSDALILNYLQQLDVQTIQHIQAVFKLHVLNNIGHKKLVRGLLEHPAFLSPDILKLLANFLPAKVLYFKTAVEISNKKNLSKTALPRALQKKLHSAQTVFRSYWTNLPVKNLVIIKDIFQKGRLDTNSEKNLLKRTLLKLPPENILLLKFLAELPTREIERLSSVPTSLPGEPGYKEITHFTEDEPQQNILVENAGLCLLAPYLPGFFKQLGYLENGIFRNKSFAIRGVYVLQFIATGQNKNPEYLLQFNKLLCGFRIDDYITKSTRLSKKEISETENLLAAVVRNWKALKNTSSNGLRESFLKRKGILFENESNWTLQVEKKGYDILLNTIPWGYGMIKFPWMKKFIQVVW